MSLDDRLRDALRAGAETPDVDGVTERVAAKRSARRTRRRAGTALGAIAVAATVVASGVVVTDDDGREVAVSPGPGRAPVVTVDGRDIQVKLVRIRPDEGYLRGPVLAADGTIFFAAYDRDGDTFTVPPSRVIRLGADGPGVMDRVDLQGEILSLAAGEGARWALTRDKVVNGPLDPAFRIKRIAPDGIVTSNPIDPGLEPNGDIVASGGAVWVPVRSGVVQVDPRTGEQVALIALPESDRRAILPAGKFAAVTSGAVLLRLDPSTSATAEVTVVDVGDIELVDATASETSRWVLRRDGVGSRSSVLSVDPDLALSGPLRMPLRFEAETIGAAGTGAFVAGTSAGDPMVLTVDPRDGAPAITHTIRLSNVRDETFTLLDEDTALLTSGGHLYRIELGG